MLKKFIVKRDYHNSRFDRWFKNNVNHVPQSFIEKLIRKKNVKVNNKKIKTSFRLQFNDIVELHGIDNLKDSICIAEKEGLNPKTIIAVDLFGQPSNYKALKQVADDNNLWILSDAAQSFGAELNSKKVGKLAYVTATSFFPAKPLGCYGDGGAIFTDDDELAEVLKSIRLHGKGKHKYDNVRVGLNARLDTIQAAILLEKIRIFDDELIVRQNIADHYNRALQDIVQVPKIINGAKSAWAQYTIQVNNKELREKQLTD